MAERVTKEMAQTMSGERTMKVQVRAYTSSIWYTP